MQRSLMGILAAAALAAAASGCATAPRVRETEPWPFEAPPRIVVPPSAVDVAPPPAPAEPAAAVDRAAASRVRFVANLTMDHQFNSIATVRYTDGSETTLGNAVIGLDAGAAVALDDARRFEVQGVGGVVLSRVGASNGNLTFLAFPVELTAHVRAGPLRLGAGPALQLHPTVRGDGFFETARGDFDTGLGAVGVVEWLLSPHLGVGLRGTWMKLSANGQSIDASRLGGSVSVLF
jgi:hypothetical protein